MEQPLVFILSEILTVKRFYFTVKLALVDLFYHFCSFPLGYELKVFTSVHHLSFSEVDPCQDPTLLHHPVAVARHGQTDFNVNATLDCACGEHRQMTWRDERSVRGRD